MKKIFTLFFMLIVPLTLSAQWFGDGLSASTAYYGVINSSFPMPAWNTSNYPGGLIYIGRSTSGQNDLEINGGGTLTINQGITVKFCTTTSDLKITGTGILNASGTSPNGISFTKDTQATWGHISFENMTTTNPQNYPSILNNCIIQYGNVSSTSLLPADPNQYGGAIHADFSYLTISNCEVASNKAGFGGGIFVGDGKNPVITNCLLHNNVATTSGGGIYFWKNSFSSCSNSIITFNNCTGSGGGGGIFIGGTAKNVKVINCIVSSNSANSQSLGYNIKIFTNTNTPKPQFINTIIWKPASSIVYVSSTPNLSDFVNCAVQDPVTGSTTNCITLNATNTDPAGPNFVATDGSNWSIIFSSPCRDAGISSGAPVIDILGKSRVGNVDIGGYEVQYSRWNGITSDLWETVSNWDANIDPASGTGDVIIPTGLINYPTGSTSQDLTIGAGKQMIIEQGARATLNNLTNNGTLKLNSTAAGFASLIINSYTKGGGSTEEIQMFLTGGGTATPLTYKWHYISSPVASLAVSTFSPSVTLDLAQWIESYPVLTLSQGWVAFDGYIYSTGQMGGPTFSTLDPGKGYDYYKNADHSFTFGGQLNTSDVIVNLNYTSGNNDLHGYNLLGNPFCSGLDWDYIVTHSFPANTSKSIYFTRNSALCSYINGVGVPGDVNGIIPPMQGFFNKTSGAGNSIIFAAAARTNANIHSIYKGSAVIPLVRLSLTDDTFSDETVVRFDDLAKSDLDYDFDATKMFLSPDLTSIYSSLGGTDYAINGLPFPVTSVEIPIVVNLTASGNHTITSTQLEGLDSYDVTLTDNSTGFVADLKTNPVLTFSAGPGSIGDRFVLKVGTITTGVEDPVISKSTFNIYPAGNMLNIQTISDVWDGKSGSVKVFDLTGKTVSNVENSGFSKNSLLQVPAPGTKGIYFVEIRSGMMRYVGKVVIR